MTARAVPAHERGRVRRTRSSAGRRRGALCLRCVAIAASGSPCWPRSRPAAGRRDHHRLRAGRLGRADGGDPRHLARGEGDRRREGDPAVRPGLSPDLLRRAGRGLRGGAGAWANAGRPRMAAAGSQPRGSPSPRPASTTWRTSAWASRCGAIPLHPGRRWRRSQRAQVRGDRRGASSRPLGPGGPSAQHPPRVVVLEPPLGVQLVAHGGEAVPLRVALAQRGRRLVVALAPVRAGRRSRP